MLKNDWTSFSAEDLDGRAKEVFVSVRSASSSTPSLGDCLKNGRTSSNSMHTFFAICSRRLNSSNISIRIERIEYQKTIVRLSFQGRIRSYFRFGRAIDRHHR